MKNACFVSLFLVMFGMMGIVNAKTPSPPAAQSPSGSTQPVTCGTLRLRRLLDSLPAEQWMIRNRFQRDDPAPRLGMQREFFAIDFHNEREYRLTATLRGMGEHSFIWVENTQWNQTVKAQAVEQIKVDFEGILTLETKTFGVEAPDVDSDGRVSILLMDIRDDFRFTDIYVAGYFSSLNDMELLYIDTAPQSVGKPDEVNETIAHELSHLLMFSQDPREAAFVEEGTADYAGYLATGQFSWSHIHAFEAQPDVSLTQFNDGLASYGASFLYVLYLSEQFGTDLIGALMRNPQSGREGVNATLKAGGHSQTFDSIYADHKVANFISDKAFADGRFGYERLRLRPATAANYRTYPIHGGGVVSAYGTDFIEFKQATADFQLTFTSRSADVDIRLIGFAGGQPVSVASVKLQAGQRVFTTSEFAPPVNRVVAAISAQPRSSTRNQTYSYSYRVESASLTTFYQQPLIRKRKK